MLYMKKNLLLILLLLSGVLNAQSNKIVFQYDQSGNQTKRYLCLNCPSTTGKIDNSKEVAELQQEDLLKFYPEDAISYYPNPVKEELYLQWKLIDNNYVSNIKVFSVTGNLLDTYNENEKGNNHNISFHNYSSGMYIISILYKNGEEKSIKIIKQ